jgi:YVTN family beta-propeller protein
VYLQPLPQEAAKIRFIIAGISANLANGGEIPLSLSLGDVKGSDLTGIQKLLAQGVLPPGSYTGISITLRQAFVQGEEGEIELFVSEEPFTIEHIFEVNRREALVLSLALDPSEIITGGITFSPAFSLTEPGKMLINFTGYVTNSGANLISVFNKKTMQVIDAIATGSEPRGIVLDQRRSLAYVAASGDDAVQVFDVFSGKIVGKIRLSLGDYPVELALSPDGRILVSVNHNSNTVSIIDAIPMFEITRIDVGVGPTSAVIDSSGLKAYIMNSRSNTVSVIDLTQRTASRTITVEGSPLRGAFNRVGDKLFIICMYSSDITVIDTSRLIVIEKIFTGMGEAASIKVDLRTGLILVGKKFGGEIAIVDPSTLMSIDRFWVRGNVAFMTIDREENVLFVALSDRKIVQKINLTSKQAMAEIEVGEEAYAVVVMGER